MSLRILCVCCDAPVANQYAPDALCERCKKPCPTCGGGVQFCKHPLPSAKPAEIADRKAAA